MKKKKPGRMRYRLVETLMLVRDDWHVTRIVIEDGAHLQCSIPLACRSRPKDVYAPSLERVTVAHLKLDPSKARIGPVLEAPTPPKMGLRQALLGLLVGRLVYVCPQCGDVGKSILRGMNWTKRLKPEERRGTVIRPWKHEDDADSNGECVDAEGPFPQEDFHCPKCDLDWNSFAVLRGDSKDADGDDEDEAPTALRYRIIELQRESEARRTWVAYETKGEITAYKPTGFLHQMPLKQVGLENLTAADVLISSDDVVAIHPVMEAPPGTDLSDLVKAFESGRAGDPDKSSDLCNASPVGAGVAEAVPGSMSPESGAAT